MINQSYIIIISVVKIILWQLRLRLNCHHRTVPLQLPPVHSAHQPHFWGVAYPPLQNRREWTIMTATITSRRLHAVYTCLHVYKHCRISTRLIMTYFMHIIITHSE